ncbi:hypothetical protein DFH09DRAFT_886485, partial [Mycena vulgaris]
IAVDSVPAIDATASPRPNPSHYIWDLWHERALAHPGNHITICWCPGHRDIEGNERADVKAKRAAQ